ncbi:hypothetical protein D9758_013996 [Tetrapyrgos nigripes]|uniref:Uncharacterized protein n=1 Tax=Tetrapyrgos nigripes TaxID=182062 RepID=A0A8H5G7V9_9AGAR|nr:hypothetical protein D9758_013996 [Tetrapyrgos nigripes]
MPPSNADLAAQLKKQGHTYFIKGQYGIAEDKYSKALQADPSNASLWCSRSACRLKSSRFLDAASDAIKATEINSQYTKAYARAALAYDVHPPPFTCDVSILNSSRKALDLPMQNIKFWERAIQTLRGKDQMTSEETNQLSDFEKLLAKAKEAQDNSESPQMENCEAVVDKGYGLEPWARILSHAYLELKTGLSMLETLRVDGSKIFGRLGTVEQISNAILKDRRCFNVTDTKFLENIRTQMLFEANVTSAWKSESPNMIKKEAVERQGCDGWEKVKLVLSITTSQVEKITNAVEIIKWGREVWRDVPREKRGGIFKETFLRGAQNLLLDTKLATVMVTSVSKERAVLLEKISQDADEVIAGIDAAAAPPYDGEEGPEFRMAFYDYPKATAYSAKALYYTERARHAFDEQEGMKLHGIASDLYFYAADCLPDDDENHIDYLIFAAINLKK